MDMIHIRATSPPDLTDAVVGLLVVNIVVLIVVVTATLKRQRAIWRGLALRGARRTAAEGET